MPAATRPKRKPPTKAVAASSHSAAAEVKRRSRLQEIIHDQPDVLADLDDFGRNTMQVYASAPQERIEAIRHGISASQVAVLADRMQIPRERLTEHLRIPRATLSRRMREEKPLTQDESERVLGLASLIGQMETVLAESGGPTGFDVAQWLARWITLPLPALAGRKPAEYLDSVEGQKLISQLLATVQTGAYV